MQGPWSIYLVLGGMAVLVIGFTLMARRLERARRAAIVELLSGLRFRLIMEPDDDQRKAAFSTVSHLSMLRDGYSGMQWIARGFLDGRPTTIFEHRYSTGSGKSRVTHYNTVVALDAPREWPGVHLTAESMFDRLGEKLGAAPDMRLEDPVFNKRWRVKCSGDETALAILTPSVQAVLQHAHADEWWVVGNGVLACGIGRQLKAAQVRERIERLNQIVAASDPAVRELLPRLSREECEAALRAGAR